MKCIITFNTGEDSYGNPYIHDGNTLYKLFGPIEVTKREYENLKWEIINYNDHLDQLFGGTASVKCYASKQSREKFYASGNDEYHLDSYDMSPPYPPDVEYSDYPRGNFDIETENNEQWEDALKARQMKPWRMHELFDEPFSFGKGYFCMGYGMHSSTEALWEKFQKRMSDAKEIAEKYLRDYTLFERDFIINYCYLEDGKVFFSKDRVIERFEGLDIVGEKLFIDEKEAEQTDNRGKTTEKQIYLMDLFPDENEFPSRLYGKVFTI